VPPERGEAAEDEPHPEHRPDEPEVLGAAVVLLHDDGREHVPGLAREVADPEEDDGVEDPPLPPELRPPLTELAKERLRLDHIRVSRHMDACQ
jgi:hypothetical protein